MQSITRKVIEIIRGNFANGIRDDFIDTSKVLRLCSSVNPNEQITRKQVSDIIRAEGIKHGSRFYFVSETEAENIRRLLADALSAHAVVYYAAFYQRHEDFFNHLNIFSSDVLRKLLWKTDYYNFYFEEFCAAQMTSRLEEELAKISATSKPLTVEEISRRLPYVPPEKILALLSNTKHYLPTNDARGYFPVARIQFDTEEIRRAERQIFSAISDKGFAAPEDYDLSSNFALNASIARNALLNLISERFFAKRFLKRRNKFYSINDLGVDGGAQASIRRLRNFVAAQNELSAEKLFAAAQDENLNQAAALSVAYEMMIRVSKNLFVRDELIRFDVEGVDDALSSFVCDKIISLSDVTSFTSFPPVEGYSWNLFLLESFLRKYSREYSFRAHGYSNKNLGAIYPVARDFADYFAVQVAVVVQEKVPLEKSAVENFLIEHGYTGRLATNTAEKIISSAGKFFSSKN